MKEYMLLVRNEADSKGSLSAEEHRQFLNDCMVYVESLKKSGNLISAQPLVREGKMISGSTGASKDGPYNETREIIVGYYHILARDMDDAVLIARRNPEFTYVKGAKVEVRPIKTVEESTSYIYPKEEKK